jgi:hypothetical protein
MKDFYFFHLKRNPKTFPAIFNIISLKSCHCLFTFSPFLGYPYADKGAGSRVSAAYNVPLVKMFSYFEILFDCSGSVSFGASPSYY